MKGRAVNPKSLLQPGKGVGGFTFVEIMIALAVGAIVIAGMYQAFNTLHKWWIATGIRSDMRQNARAGLETVTRDLEMAGYQTTNFGDVNKTGLAITLASTHEIEMDQQRVEHTNGTIDLASPVYEPRIVYYHLGEDKSGRQNLYRQIRTQPGQWVQPEIVAENVSDFTLAYLDKNNNPVDCLFAASNNPLYPTNNSLYTFNVPRPLDADYCRTPVAPCTTRVPCGSGLSPDPLKNIRRIQVTLTTKRGREAPIGPAPKPFTLTASVMPRNLEAADEVTADIVPPKVPTNLAVIDNRSCTGKLRVKWKANTEPDLAGYSLFYGPTSYVKVPIAALVNKNAPEVTLNPHDLLITKNADRALAPAPPAPNPHANTHVVQVIAYDSSGNYSGKSAPVAGDPSVDVTAFCTPDPCVAVPDTTVNPLKPSPPTGLTVSPGAAEGELLISWQAPTDGSATAGYRLYRSTAAFTTGGHIDGSLQIARETTLTAQSAVPNGTWADRHLEGCRTYYYAVASVNCDETLVEGSPLVAGYHYNGTSGDYAVNSGEPQDTTAPPVPGLDGSHAGERRILIALTNPLAAGSPDFDRTEIFWNKSTTPPAAPPHFNGTVVVNGTRIPNSDSGSPGTFKNRGSQAIVFDNETGETPGQPLVEGATYGFLAVSYDYCGNVSVAEPLVVEILGPSACSDNPPGPPPAASDGTITSCQPGSVVLAWKYPHQDTVKDLDRFRIFRGGPDGIEALLTDGPSTLTSWIDTDSLEAGDEYTYWVIANDCVFEKYLIDYSLPWPYTTPPVEPYLRAPPYATLPPNTLKLGPVFPGGGLRRYASPTSVPGHFVTTVSDEPSTYTYHNNVRFWLQNTSRSPIRIKKMAVTWDNPNVVLDRVVIGSGATERTVTVGGASPGVEFEVNTGRSSIPNKDIAGDTSDAIPVLLRFVTPTGAVNRLTDMRNETIDIELWDWNLSLDYADCPNPTRITIDVPRGPELEFFSQSAPGRDGIDSYEVTGPSGTARNTDIKVSNGIGVNVYGAALDFSRDLLGVNAGFGILKVVTTSAIAAVPVMPAGGHLDRSLETIGGDRYAICPTCPSSPVSAKLLPRDTGAADLVHWYYALAVDKTGNWDRVPNPDNGNYAYNQTGSNVCGFRPKPPVLADPTSTSTEAILTWTAPTMYSDNLHAIVADDILRYDLYIKLPSDSWPTNPNFPGLSGLSFTHSAAGTYHYKVRAKNSCVPETGENPGVSDDSNVVIR